MSTRGSGWAVLLIVLALAVTACGGDDGGVDDPGQASAPPTDVQSTPAEPSAPAADADADRPGGDTYVVESGDTLSAIAKRFNTTVRAIVRANDLADPDVIDVGQELTIP